MKVIASVVRLTCIVACFLPILSACTSAHFAAVSTQGLQDVRLKPKFTVNRSAQWRLAADTAISLLAPQDKDTVNRKRSAFALNESLFSELAEVFPATDHLGDVAGLSAALQLASQQRKQVLVWPLLDQVDDNLNSRSELSEGRALHPDKSIAPDKLVFRVFMYDVRSGALLDNARVTARGRMFAPDTSGPLDLYDEAAKAYVNAISGRSPRSARL